ncbi:unnamed protein product [Periconia digitata]|uniref:Zinc finger protein 207 n=1 Tax=Periconia digitata TaxID=1303443 RepID=A0A9W4UET9_9PLEO|nr:unnamed protein product [Periconia digitata]
MTKKRKRYPDLNQKLERPWCYYCERDFDDLKILISHQKAKHFKCERCGRRLNTAGGLSVHMNQVHKENLTHVENAIPGRQNLDIEIFGMEGVPSEIMEQHTNVVTEKHFSEEAERQRLSGNPARGGMGGEGGVASKRARVHETLEEIDERAKKWMTDRKNGVARPVKAEAKPTTPAQTAPTFPPAAQPGFPPAGLPGQPPFPPGQFAPPGALPSRPGFTPPQPNSFPPVHGLPQQIDELIASSTAATGEQSAPEKEKKAKKGKEIKLVFFDEHISPEEKMARLPRFAVQV